ncbi:MAG TPA: DUF2500 family protein [Abditibacteriaceae bacterium]|nr:DUF2500 family protein [Abditibacteriaceae bacterium]
MVGTIAFAIVSSLMQWMSDNASPVKTFEARIIAKRTKATQHQTGDATTHSSSRWTSYSYFAAFEYSNGQPASSALMKANMAFLSKALTAR